MNNTAAVKQLRRCSDCPKSASQSSPPQRRIKSNPFSTGACTWAKILIRLQVWNLFAMGGQIMRTADCKNLSKSPVGDFRQPEHRRSEATAAVRFVLRGVTRRALSPGNHRYTEWSRGRGKSAFAGTDLFAAGPPPGLRRQREGIRPSSSRRTGERNSRWE